MARWERLPQHPKKLKSEVKPRSIRSIMSETWQEIGIIAPGGTVFEVSSDAKGRPWIATGAGIFFRRDTAWVALPDGQPLARLNALQCAGNHVIAAGVAEIVYSTDGGSTWYKGRTAGVTEPITCLAASPRFARDRVLLAGTDGAGILRSTDGGKNWRHANFGLQGFAVMALETAPEWSRREVVFAATAQGLYRSPNAGRAWKKSDEGLGDAVVQALAVSPDFANDGTVFAGTETSGVFRSTDGGRTWHRWNHGLDGESELPPVNCLWLPLDFAARPVIVAGTGEGQIFRSRDGGQTWTQTVSREAPVLCLGAASGRLYAGLHDQGLLSSDDEGERWARDESLAARGITRLVAGVDNHLFAFGPWESIWRSTDTGETWARTAELEHKRPILTLAASPQSERACLLAGTAVGLLRSDDGGRAWQTVLPEAQVTVVAFSPDFATDGRVWAGTGGTGAGDVLTSSDGGVNWSPRQSPSPGVPLTALASEGGASGVGRLVAASFDAPRGQLTVWRSGDAGQTWDQWLQESVPWPAAHLDLAGPTGKDALVCAGRSCWQSTPHGWQHILEAEAPIVRALRVPDSSDLVVLTANQLLRSTGGQNWSAFDEGLERRSLQDVVVLPSADAGQIAVGLSAGGRVWRCPYG